LRVFRDGSVEYEGERFVHVVGHASGHLADSELLALDDLFVRAGYLELDESYESWHVTDMPSVFTTYSAGGCARSVRHYLGDRDAPRVLTEIENGIDTIAHSDQWVGAKRGGPAATYSR